MDIIAGMEIAGIVLAAGGSSRIEGQNKLLMEVAGKPVLVWVVEAALSVDLEPVIVVTGCDANTVGEILDEMPVSIVLNNRWQEGMSTSFSPAVNALPSETQGVMIVLGDMPAVEKSIIKKLVSQFADSGGEKIVYPVFKGQQGLPVVFPRRFFTELTELSGDRGAKSILKDHPDVVLEVEVNSPSVLMDIDTEDDLTEMEHFLKESQ